MSDENTATPIMAWWQRDEKDVDAARLAMDGMRLRVAAEGYVLQAKANFHTANADLDDAKMNARHEPSDFGAIVEASVGLEKAKLYLSRAVTAYEELFGTPPQIAS